MSLTQCAAGRQGRLDLRPACRGEGLGVVAVASAAHPVEIQREVIA